MWHHQFADLGCYPQAVDKEAAEQLLAAAAAEHNAAKASVEQSRAQLYDVVRQVAPLLRQVDIVKTTGWTREHIRRIVGADDA